MLKSLIHQFIHLCIQKNLDLVSKGVWGRSLQVAPTTSQTSQIESHKATIGDLHGVVTLHRIVTRRVVSTRSSQSVAYTPDHG